LGFEGYIQFDFGPSPLVRGGSRDVGPVDDEDDVRPRFEVFYREFHFLLRSSGRHKRTNGCAFAVVLACFQRDG